MIDAGDRDECVRIFKNGDAGKTDEWGESVGPQDQTVIELYHVKMIGRNVKEKVSGDAETTRRQYVMIGLYDKSITDEMFVEWDGETFSIENVDPKRSKDETHCLITTAKGRFDS